jgi:urease accessory protein
MRAHARLRVEAGDGSCSRVTEMVDAAPIGFRQSGEGVYVVGTAAGPMGQDQLSATVEVGPGATLILRGTAASILYGASGSGSAMVTDVTVAEGATLDWRLEPMIMTGGCRHRAGSRVRLAGSARVDWTELLVCGRHREEPGSLQLDVDVEVDGLPLLRHQLTIGSDGFGWDGPAVIGDRRVVGMRLVRTGPGEAAEDQVDVRGDGYAAMRLDDRSVLVMAVGHEVPAVSRILQRPGLGLRPNERVATGGPATAA